MLSFFSGFMLCLLRYLTSATRARLFKTKYITQTVLFAFSCSFEWREMFACECVSCHNDICLLCTVDAPVLLAIYSHLRKCLSPWHLPTWPPLPAARSLHVTSYPARTSRPLCLTVIIGSQFWILNGCRSRAFAIQLPWLNPHHLAA